MVEQPVRKLVLRCVLWLALGGWFGSWALFGLVVAPFAFTLLPTTEIAGTLVGPLLTVLHLYGAVAGLVLAWLAHALGRGRLLVALPLLLSATCLASHFGVSLQMDEIRELAFGPQGDVEAAALWNRLHRISVRIFLVASAAVAALLILHVRAEATTSNAAR
jgi:hypothetical protein